ncbi:hypothetical protein E2C01_041866 [Portunus trituberculatus]|uniref:Uncharacterized protein n=1 Tax=Portunus trituberculatus TaxID=210409 RepID=A0A5B7FKZ5_PORTR|nr:hypothetical protein [Portunus trituberculatus]
MTVESKPDGGKLGSFKRVSTRQHHCTSPPQHTSPLLPLPLTTTTPSSSLHVLTNGQEATAPLNTGGDRLGPTVHQQSPTRTVRQPPSSHRYLPVNYVCWRPHSGKMRRWTPLWGSGLEGEERCETQYAHTHLIVLKEVSGVSASTARRLGMSWCCRVMR